MDFIKGIIMAVAALILAWGIYAISLAQEGMGEFDYYTGPLQFEENADKGAYDELFDVYVDSPYLKRKVEMLQYDVDKDDYLITYYSDTPLSDVTDRDGDTYRNPSFPEGCPKSETFYGELAIGDDGVLLGNFFIEKLSYEQYLYFKDEGKIYPVSGMSEGGEIEGLRPDDDYSYVSGTPGESRVGDIRVTWETIDPADFKSEYSVAGVLNGNVLEGTDKVEYFYDYKISKDEIRSSVDGMNRNVGIGMVVVGVLGILIPAFMVYKEKKNQQMA